MCLLRMPKSPNMFAVFEERDEDNNDEEDIPVVRTPCLIGEDLARELEAFVRQQRREHDQSGSTRVSPCVRCRFPSPPARKC